MKRFFAEQTEENFVLFSKEESNHIVRVIRMREGDELIAADGIFDLHCRITEADPMCVRAEILSRTENRANPKADITLYMACSKSDKLELAAQKACELGASAFIPFISKRCVKVPDAKSAEKLAGRLDRIAFEALKQCGRNIPMHTEKPISFRELLSRISETDLVLFAYEAAEESLREAFTEAKGKKIALIVGCEGGFEEKEAEEIVAAGAKQVSLGSRILRAETAAIALMAVASYELGN